jgi:threonyl-tRNA synthetase
MPGNCLYTNDVDEYAVKVANHLKEAGVLVESDLENEKINYKVRKHSLAKVPLIIAVGRKEADSDTVAVRYLGESNQHTLDINEFVNKLKQEAQAPF